MDRPKKILVPVDLSKRSEIAIDYAAMLARSLGSWLVLMTNVNLPERAVLEDFAAAEHLSIEEAAEQFLNRYAHALTPGVDASTVVKTLEFPADGVLAAASDERVDMIVMASHGRAGMSRWMLGSVAEKIARSSDVPVVIVPARQ